MSENAKAAKLNIPIFPAVCNWLKRTISKLPFFEKPTHGLYLFLLVAGLLSASSTIAKAISDAVHGIHPDYEKYSELIIAVVAPISFGFLITSIVHCYFIYRSLLDCENASSGLQDKYQPWLGSGCEILLRWGAIILLCAIAGKIFTPLSGSIIALFSLFLFVLFVAWSTIAFFWAAKSIELCADKRYPDPPDSNQIVRDKYKEMSDELRNFVTCDLIAAFHWLFLFLLILTNWVELIAFLVVAVFLYAVAIGFLRFERWWSTAAFFLCQAVAFFVVVEWGVTLEFVQILGLH